MKKIIEEVLQAEEKVHHTLKEARAKASEIKAAVERETAAQLAEAKEQTRTTIQSAVEAARQDAARLRQEKLQEAEKAQEALLSSHADTMNRLIDDICQIVLSTEAERNP